MKDRGAAKTGTNYLIEESALAPFFF